MLQIGLFLGIPNPEGKKDWSKLFYTLDHLDQTEWRTLLIGTGPTPVRHTPAWLQWFVRARTWLAVIQVYAPWDYCSCFEALSGKPVLLSAIIPHLLCASNSYR